MNDLYYTDTAKDYRKKLQEIGDRCAELQYQLHNLQKQGNEIAEEYQIYLGLKEPKKEESDVKES